MENALSEAYTMVLLTVGEHASKMATLAKMQSGAIDKPLETQTYSFLKDFVVTEKGKVIIKRDLSLYFASEYKIQVTKK